MNQRKAAYRYVADLIEHALELQTGNGSGPGLDLELVGELQRIRGAMTAAGAEPFEDVAPNGRQPELHGFDTLVRERNGK